ncbi:MAG: hypothetical protein ACP5OA_02050 [Candidatus Woesearchaeota archaeon]
MKDKLLTVFIISFFAVSMVFAAGTGTGGSDTSGQPEVTNQPVDSGNPADTGNGTQVNQDTQNQGENTQIRTQTETGNPGTGEQVKTQVQSGTLMMQGGKQVEIKTQSNNQVQLKSGNTEAQTSMKMTQEQTATGTKLQVQLSNGKNAEIKIMPDTASQKAIEQLQLKVCTAEEGCAIELKEVGKGETAEPAYEIQGEAEGKFLGLFKTRAKVKVQVSADNGEILRVKKPFLTSIKTTG